jgi:hypothetical protein
LPSGSPCRAELAFAVVDPGQALQKFVHQITRDERIILMRSRARMTDASACPAGIFVIDGATCPKQG